MRLMQSSWLVCAALACACSSNGGDTAPTLNNVDGDAAVVDPTLRGPGTSCGFVNDAGETRFTSGYCAPNPALAGCHMCLELDESTLNAPQLCVYACRVGMNDCPTGQTCAPQSGGSRSTSGSCRTFAEPSALGYCR